MSQLREISTIAHLGLVWGLRELRAFLATNKDLAKKVKIIYVKTDTIDKVSFKRFAGNLANLEVSQGYHVKDPYIKKIKIILNNFNVETEYENGIFVACGGFGSLNKNLQNSPAALQEAQTLAEGIEPLEGNNFAVFIDQDIKNDLCKALPSSNPSEPLDPPSDDESHYDLENFERLEKSLRDPLTRFALLQQSSKKLQNYIENFATVNPGDTRKYLKRIERLIEGFNIATLQAEESYRELQDDRTIEKNSLQAKIDRKEKHINDMLEEIKEQENAHADEIKKFEESKKDLEKQLEASMKLKEESKDGSHDEKIAKLNAEIEDYRTKMEKLTVIYNQREAQSRIAVQDITDERDELAVLLEKKVKALTRLEKSYEDTKQRANELTQELEEGDFSPSKLYQKLSSEEARAPATPPHSVRFDKQKKDQLASNHMLARLELPKPSQLTGEFEEDSATDLRSTVTTQTRQQTRRPIICKPANFGLNTWNPLTTDIYVHLDKALKAGREALNVGATETSVRRMILNSLGSNCDHVENFIENAESMTLEKFAESIGSILGKKSSVQMQSFLTAQRRSGEDLLAYFTRLHMLYRSSNKLTENKDWEQDATHSMSFYSKIFDACYQAQKTELIRKTEELLEKGNLTLPRLKSVLVEVNKIDASKRNAEEPREEIALLNNEPQNEAKNPVYKKNDAPEKPWYKEQENTEKEGKAKTYNSDGRVRKPIVCWYCATPGHTKAQCFRYIKRMKEEKANPRETKTRGSPKGSYSKFK